MHSGCVLEALAVDSETATLDAPGMDPMAWERVALADDPEAVNLEAPGVAAVDLVAATVNLEATGGC